MKSDVDSLASGTEVVRTGFCQATASGEFFAVLPCGGYGGAAVRAGAVYPFEELSVPRRWNPPVGGYRVDVGTGVLPLTPTRFRELFREVG